MKCLICSRDSQYFEDTKHHIVYFECSSCQFVMKSPENFSNFIEQKERYDLHNNDENDAGYQAYFQRFIDFVLPDIARPKSALDFGCGVSSLLSQMIGRDGVSCDYYDPIYHPDDSYADQSYDLIMSVEVFEHLHNPREVFEMLSNHLTPQGYLAIQTAFYLNDRERFLHWHYRLDPTHVVFFSMRSFEVLAKQAGLVIVKSNSKNMILLKKV
ncbi:MAG: class I SAM-dependent methyltransferase [Campylobacterota bacterium]|nr:class I SAM-dependent methyltransferase [Campylobacterota bacterium]